MRIYVAGKFEDKARIQEVQRLLRSEGHSITYDWTVDEDPVSSVQAMNDMHGVMKCDAFVFVAYEDLNFRGAYAEFGMALALGKPVYILGTGADRCIFTNLPQVHRGIDALLRGSRQPSDVRINAQ